MNAEVARSIEELERQFPQASVSSLEDGQGGAHVTVEAVELGPALSPRSTWIGFHVPAQYPYADIYPIFVGSDVRTADGRALTGPFTVGVAYRGRTALQISRRNTAAQNGAQTAAAKVLKVLDFLQKAAS